MISLKRVYWYGLLAAASVVTVIWLIVILVIELQPGDRPRMARDEQEIAWRHIKENPDDPNHPDVYLSGPGKDIASRRIRELYSDAGIDVIRRATAATIWSVVNDGLLALRPGSTGRYQDDYRKVSALLKITDRSRTQAIADSLLNPKFYFQSQDGFPNATVCIELADNQQRVDVMIDVRCRHFDIYVFDNQREVHHASSYYLKCRESDKSLFDLIPALMSMIPST